jgi:hypothetical protein
MLENMTALLRLATLGCLSATLTLAGSWSGVLVDSKCWGYEEHNVNPTDTLTYVDRDGNLEIRLCSPSPKTKSFSVVQHDGLSFNLDSAGDAKAAELVRKNGKKSLFAVAITGEMSEHTITVDSISMARQESPQSSIPFNLERLRFSAHRSANRRTPEA